MAEILGPGINEYLLAHSTPADAVLRELAAETEASLPPEYVEMQIAPDEGALLTMLVRLTG